MPKTKTAAHAEDREMSPAQRIRQDVKMLSARFSYKGITRSLPYLAFMTLLCIIYISNSQRAVDIQRDTAKQEKTERELRWKYMDVKSRLMHAQMEGEIIRQSSAIGLRPMIVPPYGVPEQKQPIVATR